MEHMFRIGADVRCTDNKAGTVGGLIINPSRRHLDYIIINPGPLGGPEYYVPSGRIQGTSDQGLTLPYTYAELRELPREEVWTEQGTVQDNLQSLCVARQGMPVQDSAGNGLGQLQGVATDRDFVIRGIMLAGAPDTLVPIDQLSTEGDAQDAIVVSRARTAAM